MYFDCEGYPSNYMKRITFTSTNTCEEKKVNSTSADTICILDVNVFKS